MSDPSASYQSPSISRQFHTAKDHPTQFQHSTNGRTTGPSQFVLEAGAIDRDMPSPGSNSPMGTLRAKVTTLQDDINDFLTERMGVETMEKRGKEEEYEKKLLDGADDDSEEE